MSKRTEAGKAWRRKHRGTPSGIFDKLREGSRSRRIPFDLDRQHFINWYDATPHKCYYCEMTLEEARMLHIAMLNNLHIHRVLDFYNGLAGCARNIPNRFTIDRKISHRGYTLSNLTKACIFCNMYKGNVFTCDQAKTILPELIAELWLLCGLPIRG